MTESQIEELVERATAKCIGKLLVAHRLPGPEWAVVLRDWRDRANLVQTEAGRVLGVSTRAVQMWEQDRSTPRLETQIVLRVRMQAYKPVAVPEPVAGLRRRSPLCPA
jgi:DNA-binding XRE family transcriptional regulator